jgi:cell division protein FtsL
MHAGDTVGLIAVVTMVICIMGCITAMYHQRLIFRQRALETKVELARLELETARTALPEQAALENRVRVLERIATDRNRDLAEQIEALGKPHTALN